MKLFFCIFLFMLQCSHFSQPKSYSVKVPILETANASFQSILEKSIEYLNSNGEQCPNYGIIEVDSLNSQTMMIISFTSIKKHACSDRRLGKLFGTLSLANVTFFVYLNSYSGKDPLLKDMFLIGKKCTRIQMNEEVELSEISFEDFPVWIYQLSENKFKLIQMIKY